ncbi:glycosyltransferase [Halorarum halophilum]|uniref:Glycosyltransferase n=1 Tax=Halorarum halophilum TaxID=2743090 RepID=A0A7D5GME0_9EURY|nr:glycosyltransferase [Halobaculum halophilum]QLG28687.1 glycosyltransferase [Halobaculum halophilum]
MTGHNSKSTNETTVDWNIVSVNKLYYPQIGGVESVVRAISEGMADRGHRVNVVASVPRGWGNRERHNGVTVRKTGSFGVVKSVPIAPGFPKQLRDAARTADILHHHLPNPLGPVSDLFVSTGDAQTVVTYHSDIVRQKLALKAYKPVLKRFLAAADRIVVTSPRLRDNSELLSAHTEKCDVVPLSVPLDEYGTYDGSAYDIPIDKDTETVLFVGRLNYYKGVTHLLNAMADVDANLLIVGDGDRRTALERQVTELGLEDSVTFLGHVDDELLHYCYSVADMFVLPSVEASEAFGIVQLEAMAYELPVVNTDLPTGVPWVSVDGQTGRTVQPRDSKALAAAIQTLLDNPERRRQYGKNARQRVEEQFSRATMLDSMAAVYDSVLN